MSKVSNYVNTNDTTYGLKAAAKRTHDRVVGESNKAAKRERAKIEWENGRRRAIGQQRLKDYDRKATRLAELGRDAADMENVLVVGKIADHRRPDIQSHLDRVRERMNKIEDEMNALLVEITELADGIVSLDTADEVSNVLTEA